MDAQELAAIFDACFDRPAEDPVDRACMLGGAAEPLYLPPDASHDYGRVHYAHDYAASVLHEAAHWLFAGRRRRGSSDYGYWYLPDGRDAVAQARFEAQEWRVQAIECSLAAAAGMGFHFSADNLSNPEPSALFKQRVMDALPRYCQDPAPRLRRFQDALGAASGQERSDLLARCRSLLSDDVASFRHVRGADPNCFLNRALKYSASS